MTMTRKLSWFTALLLGTASLAQAALPAALPAAPPAATSAPLPDVNQPLDASAPLRDSQLLFTQVAPPPGSMTLRGTVPTSQIEFGVRSYEVVPRAADAQLPAFAGAAADAVAAQGVSQR